MPKNNRAVVVLRKISPGPAIVRVDGRGRRVYYLMCERDPDPGPAPWRGRVFTVARLGASFAYTVRVADPGSVHSCECIGWYANTRCVHTSLLAALIRAHRI